MLGLEVKKRKPICPQTKVELHFNPPKHAREALVRQLEDRKALEALGRCRGREIKAESGHTKTHAEKQSCCGGWEDAARAGAAALQWCPSLR